MLLNFQKQFAPYILDGSKAHTIRGERKDGKRPKPGEMLHLYTGLRQPGAEFILRAPCLRTEDFEILPPMGDTMQCPECGKGKWHSHERYSRVLVAGEELDSGQKDMLAWADGFRFDDQMGDKTAGCFGKMMRFWDGRLPFHGWIAYWDYSKAEFTR